MVNNTSMPKPRQIHGREVVMIRPEHASLQGLFKSESGQSLVEYAILLVLAATGCVAVGHALISALGIRYSQFVLCLSSPVP